MPLGIVGSSWRVQSRPSGRLLDAVSRQPQSEGRKRLSPLERDSTVRNIASAELGLSGEKNGQFAEIVTQQRGIHCRVVVHEGGDLFLRGIREVSARVERAGIVLDQVEDRFIVDRRHRLGNRLDVSNAAPVQDGSCCIHRGLEAPLE